MMSVLMAVALAGLGVAEEPIGNASANASAEAPKAAKGKAKRYCVEETLTGSRVPLRTCRTRDEWLAKGWDPTAK